MSLSTLLRPLSFVSFIVTNFGNPFSKKLEAKKREKIVCHSFYVGPGGLPNFSDSGGVFDSSICGEI